MIKIVFFGTPEFAVESLDLLIKEGYDISAVVTAPDKPAGRGNKLSQSSIKQYAIKQGLPLLQPENLKDEGFIEELRKINADLFIVIAFRMLPEIVWTMPKLGTFNLHASLLPKYRGAAPINWAIMNGEKETGVTTFLLKHEIDTGDILFQEKVEILEDDNFETLYNKLMHVGANLTLKTIKHIIENDISPIPQEGQATSAPKIFQETCIIDWNRTTTEIHNQVRGLCPIPAAKINIEGFPPMKIFQTKIIEYPNTTPGKITIDKGHLYIDAIDGRIEIIVLQPNNKKKMSAADFLSKDIEYKYLDIAEDYTLINPYIQYLKGIISAGFTIEFQNNCLQEIDSTVARNNDRWNHWLFYMELNCE